MNHSKEQERQVKTVLEEAQSGLNQTKVNRLKYAQRAKGKHNQMRKMVCKQNDIINKMKLLKRTKQKFWS